MELQKHWASGLQPGDLVKATIRHPTDGNQNIHNALVTVSYNNSFKSLIQASYNNRSYTIPYMELSKN